MPSPITATSAQGGNQSFIPISASNAFDLSGGPATSAADSTFGASLFSDGAFQVGGTGNSALQPLTQSSAQTTSQGLRNPADMLPTPIAGASSSSGSMTWLLIAGGVALVAFYFLRKHR